MVCHLSLAQTSPAGSPGCSDSWSRHVSRGDPEGHGYGVAMMIAVVFLKESNSGKKLSIYNNVLFIYY